VSRSSRPRQKGADAPAIEARVEREALIARENWLAAELELYGDPPPATQRPYEEFGPPEPRADDERPPDGDPTGEGRAEPRASK
jgi:hypothetical protein